MKTGAEFTGEFFILLVSGVTVVMEYNRSKANDKKKDEQRQSHAKAEREALQSALHELDVRVKELEKQLRMDETKSIPSSIQQDPMVMPKKKRWSLW